MTPLSMPENGMQQPSPISYHQLEQLRAIGDGFGRADKYPQAIKIGIPVLLDLPIPPIMDRIMVCLTGVIRMDIGLM